MKIVTRIMLPLLGALMLASCAGSNANGTTNLDMVCIISGEPVDTDSPSSEFMGQTVRFCCKKCKGKWDGMDDAAKKAKLAATK